MKKVLCPVEGKNGKTFWLDLGRGFDNKDGSLNLYLNAYPANGKLHVRDMDERDKRPRRQDDDSGGRTDDLPF